MRTYQIVLFFHLVGALLFFAGIVVVGMAFEFARTRRELAEVLVLLTLARLGVLLAAVGGLLLPIFGLWLVHLGAWGYGSGWVDWALGLYVVAMVLGGIGGRGPRQARELAERLAETEREISEELRGLLNDRACRAINYCALLVVVAILALMVFKP